MSGAIEAEGPGDAQRLLKQRAIYPGTITEELSRKRPLFTLGANEEKTAAVTRQLAILLLCGVPIVESVRTLSEQQGGAMRTVLVNIRERLAGGSSLSRALEDFPDLFPEFYISMVHAGETSGTLAEVLDRLADFLETGQELKARVKSASMYPLLMLMVGGGVLFFVFTFVVPKITKIFTDSHKALPLSTQVLIGIAGLFQHYWWLIAILAAVAVYGIKLLIRKKGVLVGALLYRIPVLSLLYVSRFMRTVGFLLASGVPMLKALILSAKAVGNRYLEALIMEAQQKVAEGTSLSASLPFFPPVVRQIIATGEKGGRLSEMLLRAAETFEKDFQIRVKRYLTLLEPVMILVMGLIVGFIVFSVLLPIFELNQIIK